MKLSVADSKLEKLLNSKVLEYNRPEFIVGDPICIPHLFSKKQDIEIMGFWTAMLAWGRRDTIISKAKELIAIMDNAPFDFINNHTEKDLLRFSGFKHRTFNLTDTLYFIYFLKKFYTQNNSLENAFLCENFAEKENCEQMLIHFHNLFFNDDAAPARTKKHVPTPGSKSACKRLNMFLRWMVRNDGKGVDFGLWKKISTHQLICPLDLHVDRIARRWNLLERKKTDWLAATELTENLKRFDPIDPVKYDFALFGTGVLGNMA